MNARAGARRGALSPPPLTSLSYCDASTTSSSSTSSVGLLLLEPAGRHAGRCRRKRKGSGVGARLAHNCQRHRRGRRAYPGLVGRRCIALAFFAHELPELHIGELRWRAKGRCQ